MKQTVQLTMLQVPFIANYRKEYIDPELNTDDLWKVWAWDEKVSHMSQTTLLVSSKDNCAFNKTTT